MFNFQPKLGWINQFSYLLYCVLIAGVVAIFAEGMERLFGFEPPNGFFYLLYYFLIAGILAVFAEGMGRLFGFESPRWTPNKPNSDHMVKTHEFNVKYQTNDQGLRELKHINAPINEQKRIVIIGNSYTFGWGVNNKETFPFLINKLLNNDLGGKVDAVNCGASGFDLLGYLRILVTAIPPLKPDIVVLGFLPGHDSPIARPGLVENFDDQPGLITGLIARAKKPWSTLTKKRRFFQSLFITSKVLEIRDSLLKQYSNGLPNPLQAHFLNLSSAKDPADALNRYKLLYQKGLVEQGLKWEISPYLIENAILSPNFYAEASFLIQGKTDLMLKKWQSCEGVLKEIHHQTEEIGARLVIANLPLGWQVDSEVVRFRREVLEINMPDEILISRYANDLMMGFCKKNNIPCIDLLDPFREAYSEGAKDLFFRKDSHMTAKGNRLLAKLLTQELTPLIHQTLKIP